MQSFSLGKLVLVTWAEFCESSDLNANKHRNRRIVVKHMFQPSKPEEIQDKSVQKGNLLNMNA